MDTNFIISLDSIADVNAFANTIAHFKSEIDLSSGRYIVCLLYTSDAADD